MLEKDYAAARPYYLSKLGEGFFRIGDRAKNQCGKSGIECICAERQDLCVGLNEIYRVCFFFCVQKHPAGDLAGNGPPAPRIKFEIEPGAGPDL